MLEEEEEEEEEEEHLRETPTLASMGLDMNVNIFAEKHERLLHCYTIPADQQS